MQAFVNSRIELRQMEIKRLENRRTQRKLKTRHYLVHKKLALRNKN